MNYHNLFNNYGYLLNDEPNNQIYIFAFLIQLIICPKMFDFMKISLFNILGYFIIGKTKNYFKITRPLQCENSDLDYCPISYDVPSGHSFFSIFWLLVIYLSLKQNSKNKNSNKKHLNLIKKCLMLYLVFIPFTRYLSHVHSLSAVILGCLMGIIWFIFYKFVSI